MSNFLPKEKQTAFQRWEMASFDEDFSSQSIKQNDIQQAVKLKEELAAVREQARLEGYTAGVSEGRATGIKDGRSQVMQEVNHLHQIAQAFQGELQRANELIAQEILDLALDLAKAMLKSALNVRPELILPVVSEAIHYLPSLQQPAILYLHPADATIIRQHMENELNKMGWRLSEDPHLERGGCRVETASNQIDATISTRWQRLNSSLNKKSDWLEP